MTELTVVVTDRDFEDLSIERDVLSDIALVRDTPVADFGRTGVDGDELVGADGVINLRYQLDDESGCETVASSLATASTSMP